MWRVSRAGAAPAPQPRYPGASIAYSLGKVLDGAVSPLAATLLHSGFGGIAIGLYPSPTTVISLLCETRDLTG